MRLISDSTSGVRGSSPSTSSPLRWMPANPPERLTRTRPVGAGALVGGAAGPPAAGVTPTSFHAFATAASTSGDTWLAAADRLTPQWGTFGHYTRPTPGGKRIDFILAGPGVTVLRTGINAVRFSGLAASDHEPVQAVLRADTSREATPGP